MTDIFISYSSHDEEIANQIYQVIPDCGLKVFIAKFIESGDKWEEEIINNLNASNWVIFLASEESCKSPYVQQEIGAAYFTRKNVVPVLLDISPSKLPGWMKKLQALDLSDAAPEKIKKEISTIAQSIKLNKNRNQLMLALMGIGLVVFMFKSK